MFRSYLARLRNGFVLLAALSLSACGFVDSAGGGANDAPSVSGQTITADEETQVVLTSSVSDDFDKIESYLWRQVDGPPVTLSGADQPNASFIAPTVRSEDSPLALAFQLTVTDNFGDSGVGDVTVMINAVNDLPVATADSATVAEGASQVIDVLANDTDPDGQIDPASVEIVTLPTNGTATVSATGAVSYVHNGSETLSDSFTYTVKDNEGGVSDAATVSITVTPVNDPPSVVDDAGSGVEDTALTIDVLANDTDVDSAIDPATVRISTPPANGGATAASDGTVTYVPNPNFNGADSFGYTVRDAQGAESAEATVTLAVAPVNDPPNARNDTAVTDEDQTVVINVLANDVDVEGALNPASVSVVAQPANGTILGVNNANGAITYRPDPDFGGTDSFQYQVADVQGLTDQATVTVTVRNINDLPTISSIANQAIDEDGSTGALSFTVGDQETPPAALSVSARSSNTALVPNANVRLAGNNANRSATVTPAADQNGSTTITLTVRDGDGGAASTSFTVTVRSVNDPPVANNDSASTDEEIAVTVDVLANDVDVEGTLDPASVTVTSGPANGTTSVNPANGRVTYTPNANFGGTDSFVYRVADGAGATDTAMVTVTVRSLNDPPTITVIANRTIAEDRDTGRLDFTVADDETNANALTVIARSSNTALVPNNPANLVLEGNNANRRITVIPAANQNGQTTITVTVTDGGGLSASTAFTVTVTPVADPPVANDDSTTTPLDTQVTIDVLGNDRGVDSPLDPSSVTIVSAPRDGSIVGINLATGAVTYRPNPDFNAADRFEYTVRDQGGTVSNRARVNISVGVVGIVGLQSLAANTTGCWTTPQAQALTATLADAQASAQASYAILSAPQKGSVVLVDPTTGEFRYVPNASGPRGSDSFDYRIDDPENGASTRTATVIIDQAIVPLGDSVTAGIVDGAAGLPARDLRVGYRKPLFDRLRGTGYSIDLAGSLVAGSGIAGFDPDHEGHWGWSADELAFGRPLGGVGGIFAWLSAHPADVVLLHVGTDVPTTSTMGIASILDEIDRWERSAAGNPVTVIVARIIDRFPSSPDVAAFNANLTQLVQARKADPANPDDLVLVDQSVALSYPLDLADGLHPTATGYAKMADVWFSALVDPKTGLLQRCP